MQSTQNHLMIFLLFQHLYLLPLTYLGGVFYAISALGPFGKNFL